MGNTLRDELDAFISARTEQLPQWHDTVSAHREFFTVTELATITNQIQAIHRDAILKLADEVDRLRG